MERIRFPRGCGQWPILERIPMKWNRCKWQPGGSSCTDLFDLDHSAISFRGTVAMNRMSVEGRHFLRGVPGAAMALLARGTGRVETGMGAHLSVAYEDAGDRSHRTSSGSATNPRSLPPPKRVGCIPPDPSIWPVEGAERACHMRPSIFTEVLS